MIIKYIGSLRPGVETPDGVRFDYDKPVEVAEELAKELLARGDFKPGKVPKERGEVNA